MKFVHHGPGGPLQLEQLGDVELVDGSVRLLRNGHGVLLGWLFKHHTLVVTERGRSVSMRQTQRWGALSRTGHFFWLLPRQSDAAAALECAVRRAP